MSEKWEVVVRSKKEKSHSNGKPKIVVEEKKKVPEIVPKPVAKVAHIADAPSFYAFDDEDEKVNKKENQSKKNKNPQKSAQNKKPEKKSPEAKKVKQPKTLEQAIALIDATEVQIAYDTNVGGTVLSRLLDAARFFNSKVTVDQNDETYSQMPLDYPLSIVPLSLKRVLEKVIKEASNNDLQVYLELCLSSIANNMIKGVPASGYKIIIQLIASINQSVFPKCMAKVTTLMSSYQNRPPIGISLLWAIGQGGLRDIKIGLEVWRGLMIPRIDLRHYVRFVVQYLIDLLKSHISNQDNTNKLSNDEVIGLLDFISTKRKGMPKDLEGLLNNQAAVLRKSYFEKSDAWADSNVLEQLLERLPSTYTGRKQLNDIKTKEIICCFIEGLRKKDSNYKLWRDLHRNYVSQTTYILLYMESNWPRIYPTLHRRHISNTLSHFKSAYADLLKSKKGDEGIQVSIQTCERLSKKMARSKSLVWILGSLLLLPAIAALLVVYDVQTNGSFEKSNTGRFLDNIGALEFSQNAWAKGLSSSARGYKWVEKNAPYYYSSSIEFSKPYAELAKDMSLIVSNQAVHTYGNIKDYAVEKWPVIYSTIDYYVPGFLSNVHSYSVTAWDAVKEFSAHYFEVVQTYLKTKVFIDNWAPDILRAKTLQALNTTQIYAAQYYSWFNQQVDHYAKLQ